MTTPEPTARRSTLRKAVSPRRTEIRLAIDGRQILIGHVEERASDTGRKIFQCVRYFHAAAKGAGRSEKVLGNRLTLDAAEQLIVENWEQTSGNIG